MVWNEALPWMETFWAHSVESRSMPCSTVRSSWRLCLLFIHPPAHGSEVSPAARNTLDSARIPRTSKLLICGLFQKVRVLAQDGVPSVQFSSATNVQFTAVANSIPGFGYRRLWTLLRREGHVTP